VSHGKLKLNADGSFTCTPPDKNFKGTDTFTYRVSDWASRASSLQSSSRPNLKSGEKTALLSMEGSGIAKRIRHQEKAGGS
jgi:hypothetical protein